MPWRHELKLVNVQAREGSLESKQPPSINQRQSAHHTRRRTEFDVARASSLTRTKNKGMYAIVMLNVPFHGTSILSSISVCTRDLDDRP